MGYDRSGPEHHSCLNSTHTRMRQCDSQSALSVTLPPRLWALGAGMRGCPRRRVPARGRVACIVLARKAAGKAAPGAVASAT